MNPQTGAVYKNMTKTIDGVNYRFDKYGNRVNDRTSEFKRSNYYLECDRVNGVMTIYTDSSKKIRLKQSVYPLVFRKLLQRLEHLRLPERIAGSCLWDRPGDSMDLM